MNQREVDLVTAAIDVVLEARLTTKELFTIVRAHNSHPDEWYESALQALERHVDTMHKLIEVTREAIPDAPERRGRHLKLVQSMYRGGDK